MEPNNRDGSRISRAVGLFAGQVCWKVIAGEGTGSAVHFGFGDKIRRASPIQNPSLPALYRQYDAAMSILLSCGWRLSKNGQVLGGWRDSDVIQGAAFYFLTELENLRLVDAHVRSPSYDLSLLFEDDVVFDIFCDQTNLNEADENYTLFLPQETLTVGVRSVLTIEPR